MPLTYVDYAIATCDMDTILHKKFKRPIPPWEIGVQVVSNDYGS